MFLEADLTFFLTSMSYLVISSSIANPHVVYMLLVLCLRLFFSFLLHIAGATLCCVKEAGLYIWVRNSTFSQWQLSDAEQQVISYYDRDD